MNKILLKQMTVRVMFILLCMIVTSCGRPVTAIKANEFIEKTFNLKAKPVGLSDLGLKWELFEGDVKTGYLSIAIHPSPNDAKEAFDKWRRQITRLIVFDLKDDAVGEYYHVKESHITFVRNNVLIRFAFDESNPQKPYNPRMLEKAKLIDAALQQEQGAPGVTRGDKVDKAIIDEVTWDVQTSKWKMKVHRASSLDVEAQGTTTSQDKPGYVALVFSTEDCVIAVKEVMRDEETAIINAAKDRAAEEKAAAELPERKRKTEEALMVLKNVGSTEVDCLGAIQVLSETRFPSMVPVLLNELKSSKFPSVRTNTACALAEFNDKRTIPVFLKILENPPTSGFDSKRVEDSFEIGMRYAAVRGLGNIGDPVALPVLRKVLNREKEFQRVRQEAMHAVGAMKDRQSAAMILKVVGTSPAGDINQKDRSEEESYRKVAIRAISDIGGEAALPALQKVADNELEYPRLRKYARENIGRIQYDAKEVKRLEELKKNPQE